MNIINLTEFISNKCVVDWFALHCFIQYTVKETDNWGISDCQYRNLNISVKDLTLFSQIVLNSEEYVIEFIMYSGIMQSIKLAKKFNVFSEYKSTFWAKGLLPVDINDKKNWNKNFSLQWYPIYKLLQKFGIRNHKIFEFESINKWTEYQ